MNPNYLVGDGLLTTHYFYLDRQPYLADKIFIDERLSVHFVGDFVREDMKYALVHVWVWRWQEKRMEKCMERLFKESVLKRDDYLEECDFIGRLVQGRMTNVTQSCDLV